MILLIWTYCFLVATVSHLIRDAPADRVIFRFNDQWQSWIVMWQGSFEDKDIVILDKEHKWFERGEKDAIYILRENKPLTK